MIMRFPLLLLLLSSASCNQPSLTVEPIESRFSNLRELVSSKDLPEEFQGVPEIVKSFIAYGRPLLFLVYKSNMKRLVIQALNEKAKRIEALTTLNFQHEIVSFQLVSTRETRNTFFIASGDRLYVYSLTNRILMKLEHEVTLNCYASAIECPTQSYRAINVMWLCKNRGGYRMIPFTITDTSIAENEQVKSFWENTDTQQKSAPILYGSLSENAIISMIWDTKVLNIHRWKLDETESTNSHVKVFVPRGCSISSLRLISMINNYGVILSTSDFFGQRCKSIYSRVFEKSAPYIQVVKVYSDNDLDSFDVQNTDYGSVVFSMKGVKRIGFEVYSASGEMIRNDALEDDRIGKMMQFTSSLLPMRLNGMSFALIPYGAKSEQTVSEHSCVLKLDIKDVENMPESSVNFFPDLDTSIVREPVDSTKLRILNKAPSKGQSIFVQLKRLQPSTGQASYIAQGMYVSLFEKTLSVYALALNQKRNLRYFELCSMKIEASSLSQVRAISYSGPDRDEVVVLIVGTDAGEVLVYELEASRIKGETLVYESARLAYAQAQDFQVFSLTSIDDSSGEPYIFLACVSTVKQLPSSSVSNTVVQNLAQRFLYIYRLSVGKARLKAQFMYKTAEIPESCCFDVQHISNSEVLMVFGATSKHLLQKTIKRNALRRTAICSVRYEKRTSQLFFQMKQQIKTCALSGCVLYRNSKESNLIKLFLTAGGAAQATRSLSLCPVESKVYSNSASNIYRFKEIQSINIFEPNSVNAVESASSLCAPPIVTLKTPGMIEVYGSDMKGKMVLRSEVKGFEAGEYDTVSLAAIGRNDIYFSLSGVYEKARQNQLVKFSCSGGKPIIIEREEAVAEGSSRGIEEPEVFAEQHHIKPIKVRTQCAINLKIVASGSSLSSSSTFFTTNVYLRNGDLLGSLLLVAIGKRRAVLHIGPTGSSLGTTILPSKSSNVDVTTSFVSDGDSDDERFVYFAVSGNNGVDIYIIRLTSGSLNVESTHTVLSRHRIYDITMWEEVELHFDRSIYVAVSLADGNCRRDAPGSEEKCASIVYYRVKNKNVVRQGAFIPWHIARGRLSSTQKSLACIQLRVLMLKTRFSYTKHLVCLYGVDLPIFSAANSLIVFEINTGLTGLSLSFNVLTSACGISNIEILDRMHDQKAAFIATSGNNFAECDRSHSIVSLMRFDGAEIEKIIDFNEIINDAGSAPGQNNVPDHNVFQWHVVPRDICSTKKPSFCPAKAGDEPVINGVTLIGNRKKLPAVVFSFDSDKLMNFGSVGSTSEVNVRTVFPMDKVWWTFTDLKGDKGLNLVTLKCKCADNAVEALRSC